ncbi:hypothetical protein IJI31_03335 [bacterium]|nr:hypothetical protein [bacterium]
MKKRDILYYLIIGLIIIFGCYLRINAYLGFRALWHDESALAWTLMNKSIFDYFGSLMMEQSAPPLFLILTKCICGLTDYREGALRFLPMLASLLSLPVFFVFSQKFLKNKFTLIIANFLFCINFQLIYYAQELKQYSSDVLFFMLTFLFLLKIDLKNTTTKKLLVFGSVLAIAPFISVPTLIVIGGFFIVELIRDKKEIIKPLLIFLLPVTLTFCFLYITTYAPQRTDYMLDFWHTGFLTLSLSKNLYIITKNLTFMFQPNEFILLNLLLILIGFFRIIRQYQIKENLYILTIWGLILTASALHLYPLMLRISLYTLPMIIVFLVKPLDFISLQKKLYSVFILIILFLSTSFYHKAYFLKVMSREHYLLFDARATMQCLKESYNNKDLIVVNNVSIPDFLYYMSYYNLDYKNCIFLKTEDRDFKRNKDYNSYKKILKQIPENQKVWFFYSFDIREGVEIPLLKKWLEDKKIIKEYHNHDSYLVYAQI